MVFYFEVIEMKKVALTNCSFYLSIWHMTWKIKFIFSSHWFLTTQATKQKTDQKPNHYKYLRTFIFEWQILSHVPFCGGLFE